jgi:hypothetical protein
VRIAECLVFGCRWLLAILFAGLAGRLPEIAHRTSEEENKVVECCFQWCQVDIKKIRNLDRRSSFSLLSVLFWKF